MKADKKFDHTQDITKLYLSTALLIVAPEFHLPIKIATICIGVLNRIVKIRADYLHKPNIAQIISAEQKTVFNRAWERTCLSMESHSRETLAHELSMVLNIKINELSTYTEIDLERIIEETVSRPNSFVEWYTTASDFRKILDQFWNNYEEELLQTNVLIKYYNRIDVRNLIATLTQLNDKVEYLEEILLSIRESHGEESYDFTELDLSHYFTWLHVYTQKDYHLYADLPVKEYYNEEIFDILGRVSYISWKQKVVSLLEDMLSESETNQSLSDTIRHYIKIANGNVEYSLLRGILNTVSSIKVWSATTKDKVASLGHGFGKVVLVSGEPGAGKTHFLRECLIYTLDKQSVPLFLVPLECEDLIICSRLDRMSFESLLLDRINACFGTNITSLKMLTHNMKLRIIFSIDSINRIFLQNHNAFLQITRSLKELTCYDFIYWLITINEYDLYMLDNDDRIIQDYCFAYKQNIGLFQSSFNLTAFNERTALGYHILGLYNTAISAMNRFSNYNEDCLDECFCSPVNNPLYAHILGVCGADESILLYSTAYLDFIIELTKYVDKNIKRRFPQEYSSIKSTVYSTVKLTIDTGKISFLTSDINVPHEIDTISFLQISNLLRKLGEVDDKYSKRYLEDIYQLHTGIYWVFKIVQCLSEDGTICEDVCSKLNYIDDYKGDLFMCYLLLLDHNDRIDKCSTVIHLLKKSGLLQYALFPSVKASISYKSNLMEILKEDSGDSSLGAQETFALMCFLYSYNAKTSDKFHVLNMYMASIHAHRLNYYLELLVDNLLSKIISLKSFRKNIRPLYTCKIADINYLLGYKAGAKYFVLSNKSESVTKQLYHFVDYIKQDKLFNLAEHGLDGFTFLDYLIRSYFTNLIKSRKVSLRELYSIIDGAGYFFDFGFDLIIRRNFACAAGNTYEFTYSDEYRQQFTKVVADIMDNETPEDYIFAFHFISNSVGNDDDIIDEVFIPYLNTMWTDPRLERFCRNNESRKAFFLRNIDELSTMVDHNHSE